MQALLAEAWQLFGEGLAASTGAVYSTAQRRYLEFANAFTASLGGQPLPASEELLMAYAAYLNRELTYASIKVYLCGVRALHVREGALWLPNEMPRLRQTLRGIKRRHKQGRGRKLHLTTAILERLQGRLGTDLKGLVLRAAFWVALFGLLRCGEFTTDKFDAEWDLTAGDVEFISDVAGEPFAWLTLKASKTDPFRQGVRIPIPCVCSRGRARVCPRCHLLEYLEARQAGKGPILESEPLFMWAGKALSRRSFVSELQRLLELEGFNPDSYSGHSFRSGGATMLGLAGTTGEDIQALGRWSSDCYRFYLRRSVDRLLDNLAKIAG